MNWKCNWSTYSNCFLPLLLMWLITIMCMIPAIKSSNNACDWTGSGLSTSHKDREIVSIYLRCTAGKITWNYPRGAIRILLRSPIGLERNFRACLKVHQSTPKVHSNNNQNKTTKHNDLYRNKYDKQHQSNKKIARIFLEAPKRLIALYEDDIGDNESKQIVKCFRSINEQVALYVEAEETPFENMQTTFEYNLEFINNKHHSIRPQIKHSTESMVQQQHHNNDAGDDDDVEPDHHNRHKFNKTITTIIENDGKDKTNYGNDDDDDGTWWWWWRRWKNGSRNDNTVNSRKNTKLADKIDKNNKNYEAHVKRKGGGRNRSKSEDIIGPFGESWEICRPCTDLEMAHAYCSGDIVTRGTIFNVQEQPTLETIEITIKHTIILRNNLLAILDAEDAWRHYYKTNSKKRRKNHKKYRDDEYDDDDVDLQNEQNQQPQMLNKNIEFKFHTPKHCLASHGEGEFVFMGRRRFEEVMLICAPRLEEWIQVIEHLNKSNKAPCILKSQ